MIQLKILIKDNSGKVIMEREITQGDVTFKLSVKENYFSLVQSREEDDLDSINAYH